MGNPYDPPTSPFPTQEPGQLPPLPREPNEPPEPEPIPLDDPDKEKKKLEERT